MQHPPSEPTPEGWPGSADAAQWQPLPARARALFLVGTTLPLLVPAAIVAVVGGSLLEARLAAVPAWAVAAAALALLLGIGLWLGAKRHSYTAWRHDGEGLAVRRGKLWRSETRVPASRVQHLDVKHGPWQRRRGLATLVVHTAGTRNSAVTVPHLDAADAERLRDALARQIGTDDD
ncbi:PH domain-containing protein [Lysobacter sp. A3-1-A15]|uniref:PH domain-containing protein n=1 Tax=Novilysobacter viscosus TaxID=3098602 RepID=UPI002EDA4455